ncbi:cell wall hydrolase [Metabacillus sp. GX 13764]|uniref:cell wall hydrolase n=1 Tax=Metabacillus kandeliae TaxID=2900151 RepID=UPI001E3021B6|nr:cell wall hydrolase [Metabacillus kandeliae]MCD7034735.1 cell wall hydrolase [Metabacillus kandeliae]
MAVISYNNAEVKLLARLMRAEAEGDGTKGMLLVGNVGVNRVRAKCLDFKGISSLKKMIYQRPGGFEATQRGYFFQRPRQKELSLAKRVINGQRFSPAENSLWFFKPPGDCPPQWYNQPNAGRFKSHCFFFPSQQDCPSVY